MNDQPIKPVFKAPSMPLKGTTPPAGINPAQGAPSVPQYQKQASTTPAEANANIPPVRGLYDDNFAARFNLPPSVLTTKVMSMIAGGILLFGLILGGMLFGGSGNTQRMQGLDGVVLNPEVPGNRRRCGIAERTQGCVIYLMNPTRRDREARDFYAEASRLTGVPTYTIELGNIEYATSIIRPGWIAQINIPPSSGR